MKALVLSLIVTAFVISTVASCADVPAGYARPGYANVPKKTLRAFRSEKELKNFFR